MAVSRHVAASRQNTLPGALLVCAAEVVSKEDNGEEYKHTTDAEKGEDEAEKEVAFYGFIKVEQ